MVKVQVTGVFAEISWVDKLATVLHKKNPRWYALVALEMTDKSDGGNQPIAEWFYLLACSQTYMDKPRGRGPIPDRKYTIVMSEIDLDKILKIARARVGEFEAANWDVFYQEMDKRFLHED